MRRFALLLVMPFTSGCWLALSLDDNHYSRGPCDPATEVAIRDTSTPYCIGKTEVTNRQYDAWLQTGPDPASQQAECLWNDTLVPGVLASVWRSDPNWQMKLGGAAAGCQDGTYDYAAEVSEHLDFPVRCVDWCDAQAYCKAHDARLCGKVGGASLDQDFTGDHAKSEWTRACEGPTEQDYPYGSMLDDTRCNTSGGVPLAVATKPACEGGYPGLFDMSGNVAEWIDACEHEDAPSPEPKGASHGCNWMGGSYASTAIEEKRCIGDGTTYSQPRCRFELWIGFRCCRNEN